jgi:crotonobetainyl-CoA:carnitine CoA-transferase CaiB-like acyl-CoA transferase
MTLTRTPAPEPPLSPASVERRPVLDGMRVVDFSRIFAGPLCTMTLGDLGADVVKVEPPTGDEARGFGPPWLGGEGMNFMALNRNKRSLVLDLKALEGQRIARELCADADVVVANFRPGVAERLGIGRDDLVAGNPRLVHCSVSGFGSTGPYSGRPALDLVLQGASGTLLRQGGAGAPTPIVITIADCYAASLATQGILGALLARERDGLGQVLEVTLYEAMLAAQAYRIVAGASDDPQLPSSQDVAPYGAFPTADGWVTIAVVTDRSWLALCAALELTDLVGDARFATNAQRAAHLEELSTRLAGEAARHTTADLLERLDRAGVPCGPVRRVEDLFFDEHVLANRIVVELDHPTAGRMWTLGVPFHLAATPLTIRRPAPLLGQHDHEILGELGFADAEIGALRERGVIGAVAHHRDQEEGE